MAKKEHYYTQFENDGIYHVYNRTVDRKPMFTSDANYAFFIRQFDKYLSDYMKIYAYNLLGNHFHFMIKINDLTTFETNKDLTTFKKLSNQPK
jgi:REP element-mobilizing transposase RayT